jgi:hypothetical protein
LKKTDILLVKLFSFSMACVMLFMA